MSGSPRADGSPETTERLLHQSRQLLRDIGERLSGERGYVTDGTDNAEDTDDAVTD